MREDVGEAGEEQLDAVSRVLCRVEAHSVVCNYVQAYSQLVHEAAGGLPHDMHGCPVHAARPALAVGVEHVSGCHVQDLLRLQQFLPISAPAQALPAHTG